MGHIDKMERGMKWTAGLIAGAIALLLVIGCARPPAATTSADLARSVTILYTGYGRGVLDAQQDCT